MPLIGVTLCGTAPSRFPTTMGISASIIIYPADAPACATPAARKKLAHAIVAAMEESDLISADALSTLAHDTTATLATAQVVEGDGAKPAKVAWLHYPIEPELLMPAIGKLVYSDTAKNWWDEKDRKKRDLVAIPYVDVCVFAKPHSFKDHNGKLVCKTNVLVEFSYGDAGRSDKIHRLRDPKHPFMRELSSVLGGPLKWAVVSG
jgi:hypothetical protein